MVSDRVAGVQVLGIWAYSTKKMTPRRWGAGVSIGWTRKGRTSS